MRGVVEGVGQHREVDGHAEHRGLPQTEAVGRRHGVDAGHDQPLDGLRQRVPGARCGSCLGQLDHEQRVAATALGQGHHLGRAEIDARAGQPDELGRGVVVQRVPARTTGGAGSRSVKGDRPGRRDSPMTQGWVAARAARTLSNSADASSIQWASSTTSAVGVVIPAARRSLTAWWVRGRRKAGAIRSASGVGSTSASTATATSGSQGAWSGACRSIQARRTSPASGRVGPAADAQQGPEQHPGHEVRRPGRVLAGLGHEGAQFGADASDLLQQPGLAAPGLTQDLDRSAATEDGAVDHLEHGGHLPLPARAAGGGRPRGAARPRNRRWPRRRPRARAWTCP